MARKRIKDLPDFERPREKLRERGAEALSDVELLAILLGSGTAGKAPWNWPGGSSMPPEVSSPASGWGKLMAVAGVGAAKACRIAAAFELARPGPARDSGT